MNDENLRGKQILMLAISPLYFSWHFLVMAVDPSSFDPFGYRLAVMIMGPLFAWKGRKYIDELYAFYTTFLTLVLIYLSAKNDLNYIYTFGTFLTFFTLPVTYTQLRHLLIYYSMVLAYATIWIFPQEHLKFRYIYISVLWTSSVVSFLAYYYKNLLLERIARQKQYLSDMIEHLPVGAVRVENGRLWFNRTTEIITGFTREEIPTFEDWISKLFPQNRAEALEQYAQALKTGGLVRLQFCNKEGVSRFLDFAVYRGTNLEVWIISDVTESIRGQAMLVSASKMASLGEMASGIAHEINNPLAIIASSAHVIKRLLAKEQAEKNELLELVNEVVSSVNRASKIIRNLRDFSEKSGNEGHSVLSLNPILQDTIELCGEKIRVRGIDLKIEAVSEVQFLGSKVQLSQVVLNLIINAVDSIKDLDKRWIRIESGKFGNKLHLRIIDSGNGISDKIAAKIFQPFFTTKDIGQGTGLGLSISHRIIQDHGGKLTYELYEGHTSFLIVLPAVN